MIVMASGNGASAFKVSASSWKLSLTLARNQFENQQWLYRPFFFA
jgi:hypothetical protein